MSNAIKVENLIKTYPSFALKGVSFEVPKGYITGFIGPNGAGKTTTIKSILSFIKPDGGTIELLGEKRNEGKNTLEKVGVVMDTPYLVKDWTIQDVENVVMPFYSTWDGDRFKSLLDRFGIAKSLKVRELSRGMTVKLSVSISLSHGAELLILDEPTSGLDPVAREEICELLQEFVSEENHSVLFSTHITKDLESIADYIVFILHGEILYAGPKEDLMEAYGLLKGGLSDLPLLSHVHLIGLKKNSVGFEALVKKEEAVDLPKGVLIEPVSLDELIIYFHRGGNKS
ncbi:MAG TPA: ABC transporter ATP-binding protein [Proteiniclasticum sp.]|uniref:ABC transporter ATP-binding protein n=1 Tax=Proteiniclasticum sp. TaxID=2053595 RepID=UPI000E9FDC09|nr:ABC transporter ATP-binding protein [Proteiniclasticum sp.]HBW12366.1 ABC transporter ATP-binding protein [Proteiniclasticum sp.]